MAIMPVTAPFGGSGGSAVLLATFTTERQPAVVLLHVTAPMYSLLFVESAMVVCKPSVIATELAVLRVRLAMFTESKVGPAVKDVPATYRVPLFIRPTLAPPTVTEAVMVWDGMLSCATEAGPGAGSPHSQPQLSTYAVLLSLLKKAFTGREKPGIATAVGVVAVRLMRNTESELSAKTSRYCPLGLSAIRLADGTG